MINYVAQKHGKLSRVKDLLATSKKLNHFTNNGPIKSQLESKLESMLKLEPNKKVLCFCNGTAALHALMFLSIRKGVARWVSPSFTFPSAVVGGAFDVALKDIDPSSSTLPLDSKSLNLDKYDGIILTTLFGSYVDLGLWEGFCKDQGKVLIVDNASSPLSEVDGKNVCAYGDYTFGSLHHTKYLGVGEGGFAVVPAEEYNDLLAISNFGFADNRVHDPLSSNFKMSDISAAHILAHIERYNVQKHIDTQETIIDATKDCVEFLNYAPGVVYGNLPVIFRNLPKADHTYFQSMNIVANKYYKPLEPFPNSLKLYDQIVNLPLYDSLTKINVQTIIDAIKTYSEI